MNPEELKVAVAALREAEKADTEAVEAKKAIETRATALRAQLEAEKKNWGEADTTCKATAAKVSEARTNLAAKMKPGAPVTENGGKTVFMVDAQNLLHELAVRDINAGAN